MDRRTFIKLAAIAGAGVSLPNGLTALVEAAETAARPDLVMAHGASPEKIVIAALDAMGGIRKFISRGDIVVIKPNVAWDRVPEQAKTGRQHHNDGSNT